MLSHFAKIMTAIQPVKKRYEFDDATGIFKSVEVKESKGDRIAVFFAEGLLQDAKGNDHFVFAQALLRDLILTSEDTDKYKRAVISKKDSRVEYRLEKENAIFAYYLFIKCLYCSMQRGNQAAKEVLAAADFPGWEDMLVEGQGWLMKQYRSNRAAQDAEAPGYLRAAQETSTTARREAQRALAKDQARAAVSVGDSKAFQAARARAVKAKASGQVVSQEKINHGFK